jgi:hypothetical protein
MYHHVYMRNGAAYVPTVGKMGKGFYRDIEPVAVVAVGNTEALRKALEQMIFRGNPDVPILRFSMECCFGESKKVITSSK